MIVEQFRRVGGLQISVEVEECVGSPDGLGWRSRVGFAVDSAGRAGLRRHRSHDIQVIDTCLIAHPAIQALEVTALPWPGAVSVDAIASTAGNVALIVEARRGQSVRPQHPDPEVAVARRHSRDLVMQAGDSHVTEHAAGRDWHVGLLSFWQIHPAAADVLVDAVRDFTGLRSGDCVLDLYAGAGLFAGALVSAVAPQGRVVAIESSPTAVQDAAVNLTNTVEIRRALVEPGLVRSLAAELGRIDVVILDPPRTGAGRGVVEDIAAALPRAVVYVACDPAALARDVATFATVGYAMTGLRAFDLFPMTAHVECVALLTRVEEAPSASVLESGDTVVTVSQRR